MYEGPLHLVIPQQCGCSELRFDHGVSCISLGFLNLAGVTRGVQQGGGRLFKFTSTWCRLHHLPPQGLSQVHFKLLHKPSTGWL